MKRDAYNEDGPTNKRQRQNDDEVTFLIPSKVAGSIIGKGGVNISQLRNQFKASITVPDCPGPERVLSITAADLDTTLDVVKEILPKIQDAGSKGVNTEELDVRLLIHQSRAGCVIGKGGSKIKELREKTGARLKIFSNTAPQSTERVVQLIGNDEAVAAAVREVIDLIRQTPIKGPVQQYDPHNYDDFYAEEYGGFGGGGPRPRVPPRGPQRGGPGPAGRGPPPIRGPPPGRGPPRPFGDFGPRGGFGGPPRGNFAGNFPAGGNFPPGNNRAGNPNVGNFNASPSGGNQDDTTTQVTIPKDLAGAIIGKAGTRIRKIRAESGAGIEIAEPLPAASERIITITGTPQSIQMAQYLLQQRMFEEFPGLAPKI